MIESPLVSVMVTSYNQRDDLIRAVESVLNQTYDNIQIVIADDCSKQDDSREVIQQYLKEYPEKVKAVFQSENVGISRNKVAGFRACDGAYITYLDGDDFYYPEKIAREVEVIQGNPAAKVVYSNFAFVREDGAVRKIWNRKKRNVPEGMIFGEVYSRSFPNNTIYRCELIEKNLFQKIGYYDESLAAYEDWDARIRYSKTAEVCYSDYVGSSYVDAPESVSRSEDKKVLVREAMNQVIKKNLSLLEDLPSDQKDWISRRLNNYLSRKKLFTQPTIGSFIKHMLAFPKDIFDFRFSANLLVRNLMH